MKDLKEKVVLITGASSGIGKKCAEDFAEEGSFLSITGRNLEGLMGVKDTCISSGVPEDKVLVVQGDLENDDDVERIVSSTISHFGRLDILVNNAGMVAGLKNTQETTLEDFDKVMNVNVRSAFYISKLAIPHLIQTKGNVVNVSSICSFRPYPTVTSYSMSKAALDQFTRCLALELADKGVRVNSVNPGFIITPIHKRCLGINDEGYMKLLEDMRPIYPLGRLGEVQDVSKMVLFLASSDCSYTTGTIIPIDSGNSLMPPSSTFAK